MKQTIITIAAMVTLAGCKQSTPDVVAPPAVNVTLHSEPAPGYKVVCDGNGIFSGEIEDGQFPFAVVNDQQARTNIQDAIEDTWIIMGLIIQDDRRDNPLDTMREKAAKFHECN